MTLTVADWSILGAVIAYMAPIAIAKYGAIKSFDNSKPRDETFYQDPFRKRALWAHQNGLEGFAFFAAAVVIAASIAVPPRRRIGRSESSSDIRQGLPPTRSRASLRSGCATSLASR